MAKVKPNLALLDETRLTGQLLIAMPVMEDPRFVQSVIYLCAHTQEGAMGLVLNNPLTTPSFEDLLRQLDVAPTPPRAAHRPLQRRPHGQRPWLRAAHRGLDR